MNISVLRNTRRLLPRWRSLTNTITSGTLSSSKQLERVRFSNDTYKDTLLSRWLETPSLENANDVFQHAIILNDFSFAQKPIKQLVDNKHKLPNYLQIVLNRTLVNNYTSQPISEPQKYSLEEIYTKIRDLRVYLKIHNRDAFSWAELARMYTTLNLKDKAIYAMNVAYNIYPNNRYILRCLIRLFSHYNEFGQLHKVFKKTEHLYRDPWLLAPYLSLVDKLINPNVNAKKIREALNTETKLNKTELESSFASLELRNGSIKNAKRLYRLSLTQPNDNSLSQAIWASSKLNSNFVEPDIQTSFMYEPLTRTILRECRFEEAFTHSLNWINDEPFSSVPSATASYIACAFLDQFEASEHICRSGLISNPDDSMLKNNLVYSLLMSNKVQDARNIFETIDTTKNEDNVTYLATYGLLLIKETNIEKGREFYKEAIQEAKKQGNKFLEELANIHYVKAELDICQTKKELLLKQLKSHEFMNQQPEVVFLREKIKDEILASPSTS